MDRTLHILLLVSSLISINFPPIFFSETARFEKTSQQASSVAVLIEAVPNGSTPSQEVGYCQTGQSTVTFTNQGMANDPAMSIINDLSIGIALGDAFALQDSGFFITGVSIAGVSLNSFDPLNSLSDNPQFSTDPDGAGGLSDTDTDGFFDDLELGGSVEITINYEYDCSQASNTDPNTNCLNNSSTSLNARLQYLHNGQQESFSLDKYLRPANENFDIETFSDPDAYAGIDTFTIVQTIIRRIRSFETTCNGSGEFRVAIEIPNQVVPITDRFRLVKNGEDEVPIMDVVVTTSEMNFTFDASFSDILSGEYELEMVFTSECLASLGPSVFPVSFSHSCPACSCDHIWFCGDVEGPYFHILSPECPGEFLWDCSEGVLAHSFEVDRVTYGFSDPAFTSPFDPNLANKKVGLPCDKVSMTFTSTVGATPIADSIGISINYGTPFDAVSQEELFLFENGSVRITDNDSVFDCPVTSDMITVEMNGSEKTVYFDLHACLAGLGVTLSEGDSINLSAVYSINPDAPISTEFAPIPNFRAVAYHVVDGVRRTCDSFGDLFYVGKSRAIYDFPNTAEDMPNGCNTGELHFRLFVPENKFMQFFGNELRQAQKIDSFVLDFDPVLLNAYGSAGVMVSVPGHPVHGNDYFSIKPLSDFPSGHYVANFDTLDHVPALNTVEQYSFDLQLNLTPNCLASVNDEIDFQSEIFYKDRFYASVIDMGGCVADLSAAGSNTIYYAGPVNLEVQPVSPMSATVNMGVAEWTVQVCNTSTTSNANTVWVAIEDGANVLNVLSLENVDDPQNPIDISLTPYGVNHQFAIITGLVAGQCVDLKLSANTVGCQNLDFQFVAGWDCGALNQPNWTPDDNTCIESFTGLNMVNAGISPVNLQIDSWTSECLGPGMETLNFLGFLNALTDVPTDNFTLIFTYDENGDGMVQPTETTVHQESYIGAVTVGSPLVLNTTFSGPIDENCSLIVTVEADNTNLCDGIEMPLPVPQLQNAGQDQYYCSLVGGNIVTNVGVSGCGMADYFYTWEAIPPADLAFLDNASSANPMLTFDPNGFVGNTLVYVLETQKLACAASTFDTVRIVLPNTVEGFFLNDTVQVQSPDCASGADFCLGIQAASFSEFVIELDGSIFPADNTTTCNGTEVAVPMSTGLHSLVLNNIVSGCNDSVTVNVYCTQTEVIDISLPISFSDTICLNANELDGAIETVANLCLDGSFAGYQILDDTCIVVTGQLVGNETACYIACDAGGFCDTTLLNISVTHPYGDGLSDTIVVSQNSHFCFEESLLNLNGTVESFENTCTQSGMSVLFNLDPINNCVFYDGLEIGTDEACLTFCNVDGECDTINYSVTVVPGSIETDSVFINVDTNIFCVDSQLLPGNIIDVSDFCPDDNGEQVFFEYDGTCVSYFGNELGTDTTCIRVEDEFGNVAIINLIVTVVKTTPETICDTIFVGQIVEYCLDTFELPGFYQTFNILYDNTTIENVDFEVDPVELCVLYEGLDIGRDSFSVELCDHYGFCDTTSFCLKVDEYFDPPSLHPDVDTTLKETPIVVDVLSNDTVFGGMDTFFILDPPISGDVRINFENSITYIPNEFVCDRDDQFTYVVCNPNGCDTTTVDIYVECIELTIFNAVSPNNDGYNDYFYIAKVESFTENQLWIYNRWGIQVYHASPYDENNLWPGTWGNDIDLPDGTYFYIFEWLDDGQRNVQRGYIEMQR